MPPVAAHGDTRICVPATFLFSRGSWMSQTPTAGQGEDRLGGDVENCTDRSSHLRPSILSRIEVRMR
ncbi:MAG: hypothetical protein EBS41_03515 [Actinobacteria bacterium]|nr:hypothetical protein [Actinomycetota bacterium]